MQIRIDKITIRRLPDEAVYRERETAPSACIGIVAQAQVSYPTHDGRRLEILSSGGLWGIDEESEETYLQEVERDELQDLKEHLAVFGVDIADFDEKARSES